MDPRRTAPGNLAPRRRPAARGHRHPRRRADHLPWFNTGWDGGRPVSKQPKHGFGRVSFWAFDETAVTDRHVRYTLDSTDFGDDLLAQLNSGDHPRFHATYDL